MPQIVATNVLTAGLRSTFADTMRRMYGGIVDRLSGFVQFDVPSDKLTELYAYFTAAPHARRWVRGEDRDSGNFDSVGYSVTNHDWSTGVTWHANDRDDDQTRSLMARANDAGASMILLHERAIFQALLAATDANLLPSIPNAPDGAALFSATNGAGGDRFEVSGGNVEPGGGVATAAAVRTDLWSAVARFNRFLDGRGQPLLDASLVDMGVTVIAGAVNTEVFREAFTQTRTAIGANTATSNAAVTNTILESGMRFKLILTPRITSNDWFVAIDGVQTKPLFIQTRKSISEYVQTMENSDIARRTKEEGVFWDSRFGLGVNLPYGIVQVNN